jgi:TonB family protein
MRESPVTLVVLLVLSVALGAKGSAQTPEAAQVGAAPQVEAAGGITPPRLTKQTKPKYPRAAFDNKIQGDVVVELLIDTKGRVAKTRVVQSVPGLDEAAVECVREWRFRPALKRGKPIATVAKVPVTFRIF